MIINRVCLGLLFIDTGFPACRQAGIRAIGLQPCIFSKRKFHGLLILEPAQKCARFLSYTMVQVQIFFEKVQVSLIGGENGKTFVC